MLCPATNVSPFRLADSFNFQGHSPNLFLNLYVPQRKSWWLANFQERCSVLAGKIFITIDLDWKLLIEFFREFQAQLAEED